MAYQRPGSTKAPQQQTKSTPSAAPASAKPTGGGTSGGAKSAAAPQSEKKPGGNKPAFRLAVMELNPETGKRVTQKDPETGKTKYAGAAWANKFGGFNIKLEGDLQVDGDVELRLYPVDDDQKFRS